MLRKLEVRLRLGRAWWSAKESVCVCDCACVCGVCSVVGEGEGEDSVDELVSKESYFVRVLSMQMVPPENRFERRGYLRSEERLVSNCFNSGYGSQSVLAGERTGSGLSESDLSSCA
jgi:hypothetical protein